MDADSTETELKAKRAQAFQLANLVLEQREEQRQDLKVMTGLLQELVVGLFQENPMERISRCECRWWSVALPDRVFHHSDAESALLMAWKKGGGHCHLQTGEVDRADLEDFYISHQLTRSSHEELDSPGASIEQGMWLPALPEVWNATSQMRRLGELAAVHRGIEFNTPFRANESILVSDTAHGAFVPGVQRVKDAVEPFIVLNTVHLNTDPEFMKGSAYKLPWNQQKLIVNAGRRTRGPWTVTASIDYEGIVCYQNFQGIRTNSSVSLETLAAILNGPVANAFVATREGKRDVQIQTLRAIPCPELTSDEDEVIASLVRKYGDTRRRWLLGSVPVREAQETCGTLLRSIDAEVLRAYDLSPVLSGSS